MTKFRDRYIKAENICIGDTIRWTETVADLTVSKVGTVARRQHMSIGTEYTTKEGAIIGIVPRDRLTKPVITLLAIGGHQPQEELEGWNELVKSIQDD